MINAYIYINIKLFNAYIIDYIGVPRERTARQITDLSMQDTGGTFLLSLMGLLSRASRSGSSHYHYVTVLMEDRNRDY